MRVIAGEFKGRRLRTAAGSAVRPTSDRVREALFSILGDRVYETRVLDLFAGSGALGIEALSRGAGSATFVDSSPAALHALRSNLAAVGAAEEIRAMGAISFLRSARLVKRQYDLVFIDPPYAAAPEFASQLSEHLPPILAVGALMICESDHRSPLDLGFELQDERRYGDTLIRIYAIS